LVYFFRNNCYYYWDSPVPAGSDTAAIAVAAAAGIAGIAWAAIALASSVSTAAAIMADASQFY